MKFKKIILCIACVIALTACGTKEVSNNGLVILQAYGNGGKDDGAINRSFIELYNNSNNDIDLDGYTINYNSDSNWITYGLTGVISKQSSYLIAGTDNKNSDNNYYGTITDTYADLIIDLEMSNDVFTICLLSEDNIQDNPSDLESYIDMLGAGLSNISECNSIEGISKQKSARRKSLVDNNDNSIDFEIIDFRIDGNWDIYKPYSSSELSRNPIVNKVTEETDNALLIYQVYGTGGKDDGAINRSFIQLINTSNSSINLEGYVIYYISDGDANWKSFELSGTIDADSSYLIVGTNNYNESNSYFGIIDDNDADLIIDLEIDNKSFTICLISSKIDLTSLDNPYLMNIEEYVDMVGAGTSAIYENDVIAGISKQKSVMRSNLIDTNNNSNDFEIISYNVEGNWNLYKPF